MGASLTHREEPPLVLKSAAPKLSAGMSGEEALCETLNACAETLSHNLLAAFETDEPKAPHQIRVALRRLRTNLKDFRPFTQRKPIRELEEKARDLFRAVGPWRDADVLDDAIMAPVCEENPDAPGLAALRRCVRKSAEWRRSTGRAHLRSGGASSFALRLAREAARPSWAPSKKRQRAALNGPARDVAREALRKRWRGAAIWGDRISDLSIPERHELRKSLKGVRYSIDAFAPLFGPGASEPFDKRLKKMQNVLGYLNDVAAAETLRAFASADPRVTTLLDDAVEQVLAWHNARADAAWVNAQRLWADLDAVERFW